MLLLNMVNTNTLRRRLCVLSQKNRSISKKDRPIIDNKRAVNQVTFERMRILFDYSQLENHPSLVQFLFVFLSYLGQKNNNRVPIIICR
jgi:hypothetical protein